MANNVNNVITGVIDIPGALRSRGAADGNLVGGVVAYAGDIYDTLFSDGVNTGMNQADINEYLKTNSGTTYTHPASHPASMITYNASTEYESGNVGYEIKQLVTSLAAKYVKPGTGVPKTDLANDVLTSLGYADDYYSNKSSFVTSTALETTLAGLSPYSAGSGISITTVSNGKLIAVDTAVYKVKDVLNASGVSLITSGIATIPITQINKSDNTLLSPVSGVVTLPAIPNSAADISFDDNVAHLSTQQNPVNNVQQAIQKIAVGISGGFSDVTITLKTNGEQPVANKEVTIAVTYQGETYDLTNQSSYNNGFATDSNGHIALTLPLGAVYQISFHQYNVNYSTPDTLNGIIDKPICNLTGLYVALSNNEAVLINVNMLNTTPSTTPNNKEVYIDYYISGDWVHSYTAVLSAVGTPKTIKDVQGNIIKSGNNYVTIDIPKNTQFRVRLQLWDTSLTEKEQIYIASSNISKIASNARSIINMSYTYALPGLYLIIKDSTTEKGYAEYKILNVDSTNNTMEITINGINYTLSKDSNNNIYRKETNSADSPAQWFTQSSSSDILGVGIRSSLLISKSMNDEFTYNLGYTNCCFRIARNFIEFNDQVATTTSPNIITYSNVDGMFQTRKLASFSETQTFPSAQKAINNYKQTLNTSNGSVTIDGFIPATSQMEIFRTNYTSLMFIIPFINGPTLYSPYKNQINYSIGCSNNVDVTTIGQSSDNYRCLKGDFTSGSSALNTRNANFFVFYPF